MTRKRKDRPRRRSLAPKINAILNAVDEGVEPVAVEVDEETFNALANARGEERRALARALIAREEGRAPPEHLARIDRHITDAIARVI